MPETIPLRATLGVKSQDIIVDHAIGTASLPYFVLIRVSAIAGVESFVERPVERNAYT